ncbi:WD repeat-containing protein [Verticillium dahliae VdLs.17]|uniref:WD repeat-containing protein JIP5 n=1 Tax=Verticillium dahliae (strain VdLs.17 / ATCC MYA-4575 / FGSC 10137) TaxID=498257 RepID=G2X9A3_VERDV|nr:WD repeat-containing protein [Verticillium dahliae VdLs.17]EGY15571.1 WD repeat-containing protein [Verticillium dahliae VdLs.17]
MLENLCTLPLTADVFTAALHPTKPLLSVGLSNGRVETFRLPAVAGSDDDADDSSDAGESKTKRAGPAETGKGMIESVWSTRRHKGSCRTLAYSYDGSSMFSAGTDGLVKHFSPEDGKVLSKTVIPSRKNGPDGPSTLHALNPQSLLLGCDSGAVYLIDIKDGVAAGQPHATHRPHEDYVSAVVALPPTKDSTSGVPKQWVSTGGTTLAASDWRRGVLSRSEDQEDELMCAAFVPGVGPRKNRNNGMVAVGSGSGVITLWDRGAPDDQQERIILECMALVPAELGWGKKLIVGVADGTLRVVDIVKRKVDAEPGSVLRHDDLEGAVFVGFDCYNRLISAGGRTVKVWQELAELQGGGSDGEDDDDDDDGDSDDDDTNENGKRGASSGEEDSDDSDAPKKKRGKRRKQTPKKQPDYSFPDL